MPNLNANYSLVLQASCRKVMFSDVTVHQSVILSRQSPHVTITHDALGLTILGPTVYRALALLCRAPSPVQNPSPCSVQDPALSNMFKLVQLGPHCTGTRQTCSNLFIMKHIQL